MKTRLLYIILFLYSACNMHSQDNITKNDGTNIEAIVLSIDTTSVVYRFFNYPEGPKIRILKSEITYIIYKNGSKDFFNQAVKPTISNDPTSEIKKKTSVKKTNERIFAPFMFHAGFVFNNRYTNVPLKDPDEGMVASLHYSPASQHTVMSFQLGFNFY